MRKRTGIIFPWDKSTFTEEDQKLLAMIAPYIDLIKIGLEAMTAYDSHGRTIASLVCNFAREHNIKVMWDMKLHDIRNTVGKAMNNIVAMAPTVAMSTLHASASDGALIDAAEVCGTQVLPLAVTVLTDLGEEECVSRFGSKPDAAVLRFAENAYQCGISGLVCSPQELTLIKGNPILYRMTKVIPGIRPEWAQADDQKRTMTPKEAALAGATYLVIGRPIANPPKKIGTPVDAARLIRKELDEVEVSG